MPGFSAFSSGVLFRTVLVLSVVVRQHFVVSSADGSVCVPTCQGVCYKSVCLYESLGLTKDAVPRQGPSYNHGILGDPENPLSSSSLLSFDYVLSPSTPMRSRTARFLRATTVAESHPLLTLSSAHMQHGFDSRVDSVDFAAARGPSGRTSDADAAIAKLASENGLLREEIDKWQRAGPSVEGHKSKARITLQQIRRQRSSNASLGDALSQLKPGATMVSQLEPSDQHVTAASGSNANTWTGAVSGFHAWSADTGLPQLIVKVGLFLLVVIFALAVLRFLLPFGETNKAGMRMFQARSGSFDHSSFSHLAFKVSQLSIGHIDNLRTIQPVYLRITWGGGKEMHTCEVMPSPGSSTLLFCEEFNLTLTKINAPVCFALMGKQRGGEELAAAEIPVKQFVHMALEPTEFFRFELCMRARSIARSPSCQATWQPYVSMCLRAAPNTGSARLSAMLPGGSHA